MAKCAWIGLGVMGYRMAGHLVKRGGHEVTVYNRNAAKAERWTEAFGGRTATTPRAAAEAAEFVMMCVGNDADLRSIAYGDDGAFAGLAAGSTLIDHTTASAEIARELDAHARARGCGFVDAPVSGGQAGAENGALVVMCGGEEDTFARARPQLACYGKAVIRLGPVGSGQLTKMVNQICIAGLAQGLAEAINFGMRAGLAMDRVLEEVLLLGDAQSIWMQKHGYSTLQGEHALNYTVNWLRKDLKNCLAEADRNGAPLPATALIRCFLPASPRS